MNTNQDMFLKSLPESVASHVMRRIGPDSRYKDLHEYLSDLIQNEMNQENSSEEDLLRQTIQLSMTSPLQTMDDDYFLKKKKYIDEYAS